MKLSNEVRTLLEEQKIIKTALMNDWEKMSEEQVLLFQEEIQDIQEAIKEILNKKNRK